MKPIYSLTLLILFPFLAFSQNDFNCGFNLNLSDPLSNLSLNKSQVYCMKNGNAHTPKGNLHTMMVFVTFTEDQNNTNAENTIAFWPKNGIPTYASNILNLVPNTGPISTKSSNLSGYYETMSGYNGTGGFSVTGKIFHVTISKQFSYDPNFNKAENLMQFEKLLCQRTIIALQNQYPSEDWSLYDKRDNVNGIGTRIRYTSDNNAIFSDKIIDYISLNFRLLPSDLAVFRSNPDAQKRNGVAFPSGLKSWHCLIIALKQKNNQSNLIIRVSSKGICSKWKFSIKKSQ